MRSSLFLFATMSFKVFSLPHHCSSSVPRSLHGRHQRLAIARRGRAVPFSYSTRDGSRRSSGAEHDDSAAESAAGQSGTEYIGVARSDLDEAVDVGRGHFEIVTHRGVRLEEQPAESWYVPRPQGFDGREDPCVFGDDVTCAPIEWRRQIRESWQIVDGERA
jgi:hypothetical protein